MSLLHALFTRRTPARFSGRLGLFHGAYKVWNCLAFHLIVDDQQGTLRFTVAIPGILTIFLQTPQLPRWLGATTLAGGYGERAEYGLWHDYNETKLQWRRIINKDGPGSGWEKRWVRRNLNASVVRHESLISSLVADQGEAWEAAHGLVAWTFMLTTWRAISPRWWVPCLYDHHFVLSGTDQDGNIHDASYKAKLGPYMSAEAIFDQLTAEIFPNVNA